MPEDPRPLSEGAKTAAVRVAGKHRRVQPFLRGRNRAVVVEPNITDRRQAPGSEQAVVGLYDYSNNRSLVAVVDVKSEEVLHVEETPVQFQLAPDEQKEAEALAAGDSRVEEFLRNREMNPITRLYFPPQAKKDSPPHRYAIVFVRPDDDERRFVVVDLSEQVVVDVFGPETLPG